MLRVALQLHMTTKPLNEEMNCTINADSEILFPRRLSEQLQKNSPELKNVEQLRGEENVHAAFVSTIC